MSMQPLHRVSPDERVKVEEAILKVLERLTKERVTATPQSSILYELATKFRAKEIENALQRLSVAKKIVHFPRLRGWFLMCHEEQAKVLVSNINEKQVKRNLNDRLRHNG